MKVTLRQREGVNFVATTASGHDISVDGSPDIGGGNRGARPMEMLLVGLGGCSAIDVLSILQKSRQEITNCEIEIAPLRSHWVRSGNNANNCREPVVLLLQ